MGSARASVESLWDFAPADASDGVVFHAGSFSRALALVAYLETHQTPHPDLPPEAPKADDLPPLVTPADWKHAGLDPSLDAAAFSWPDRARGALFVLPLGDRERFRAAFKAKTREEGGRVIDDVIFGYSCVTVTSRFVCAEKVADIDAAAARHSSPVAYGGEHPDADDTGDIEIFATPTAPHVAHMAKDMQDYGEVLAVASAVRFRDDGATVHVHVRGELRSGVSQALLGNTPSKDRPMAAGAPTSLRVHFDPVLATSKAASLEPRTLHEFIEQLTGDVEVTTSGRGLIGLYSGFELKDPARVEAYVKEKCAEANGWKLGTGLRSISVTPHGCSAVFDSRFSILPVSLDPIPVSAEVHGRALEIGLGGAAPPGAVQHTTAVVAAETDAALAVADREAIVAFTKSPWIGPDIGAGDTFRRMFWFIDKRDAARIDGFNDAAAHIAQAFVAARIDDDGLVANAGFITFERDPPEAQRAYDLALSARASRSLVDYRAELAAIEKSFPGSLVAQRAFEVRTATDPGSGQAPYVGAGAVALGLAATWLEALDSLTDLTRRHASKK
jgi:hypothetical protein